MQTTLNDRYAIATAEALKCLRNPIDEGENESDIVDHLMTTTGLTPDESAEVVRRAVEKINPPVVPVRGVAPVLLSVEPNSTSGYIVADAEPTPAVEPACFAVTATQPDANGEFATPADGAKFMAAFGIPQTPLNGKAPILSGWPESASTDFKQIDRWAQEHPGCNFGSVAKATLDGFFVVEIDSQDFRERFKRDTGSYLVSKLAIASRQGGHRWYKQSPDSLALGNVGQTGKDFSVRLDNEQAVSPGSIHPISKRQYAVCLNSSAPEIATPETIQWLRSEQIRLEAKVNPASTTDGLSDDAPIVEGGRNSWLASQLGKVRQAGLNVEEMEEHAKRLNLERCQPPLSDDEVLTVVRSIARYPIKDTTVLVGGVPAGTRPVQTPSQPVPNDKKTAIEMLIEREQAILPLLDTTSTPSRPVFPSWVLTGTSVNEGLVKPALEASSKHDLFIFMPTVQIIMNYLSGRVRIQGGRQRFNLYLSLISPYGKFFKSSAAELAQSYCRQAGMLGEGGSDVHSPDYTVVQECGSAEGFCMRMRQMNGKHAILYNDELSTLTAKLEIKAATLSSFLLKCFDSARLENQLKRNTDSYLFEAQSYTFGWISCTTETMFPSLWAKIAGDETGIQDRMFFLVSPKEPKPFGRYGDPDFHAGSERTRQLVDKAIRQGVYRYGNSEMADQVMQGMEPRSQYMLETLALFFAVDLGLDEIDEDCLERAAALIKYRHAAIDFIQPVEADNENARIEQSIRRELRRHSGLMPTRDLERALNSNRIGTKLWQQCYVGLVNSKHIVEFQHVDPVTKRQTTMTGLRKLDD